MSCWANITRLIVLFIYRSTRASNLRPAERPVASAKEVFRVGTQVRIVRLVCLHVEYFLRGVNKEVNCNFMEGVT